MKCPECSGKLVVYKTIDGPRAKSGSIRCRECTYQGSYTAVLTEEHATRGRVQQLNRSLHTPLDTGELDVVLLQGLWRIVDAPNNPSLASDGEPVDGGGYTARALALVHLAQLLGPC